MSGAAGQETCSRTDRWPNSRVWEPGPAGPPFPLPGTEAACLAGCPCCSPVSPTPLCPKSPQGGCGGAPGWRHSGAPSASQKHHLPPPTPAWSLALCSETCDLPTTHGRWACPGPLAPTGASQPRPGPRAAGGTGRRAPEAELRLGGFLWTPWDPLPFAASKAHMHTHAHSCTHSYTHTSTQLHAHAR